MRRCRYCGWEFQPAKSFYYYCTWECRVADVGPNYERDYRGHQRERDTHYDRGYNDGVRSGPMNTTIPPGIWKAAIQLVHPDRWADNPSLAALAHEVTIWLNQHRPQEPR